METNTIKALSHSHTATMSTALYDDLPVPDFLYVRAASAYSAMVQLYARSRQLPTATTLFQRKRIHSDYCRLGCRQLGDTRHLFVECPHYEGWKRQEAETLATQTGKILQLHNLPDQLTEAIVNIAKSLFQDSDCWPLSRTTYFLGHVPSIAGLLSNHTEQLGDLRALKIRRSLATEWHNHSVRLAGRIYGDYARQMAILESS